MAPGVHKQLFHSGGLLASHQAFCRRCQHHGLAQNVVDVGDVMLDGVARDHRHAVDDELTLTTAASTTTWVIVQRSRINRGKNKRVSTGLCTDNSYSMLTQKIHRGP